MISDLDFGVWILDLFFFAFWIVKNQYLKHLFLKDLSDVILQAWIVLIDLDVTVLFL